MCVCVFREREELLQRAVTLRTADDLSQLFNSIRQGKKHGTPSLRVPCVIFFSVHVCLLLPTCLLVRAAICVQDCGI